MERTISFWDTGEMQTVPYILGIAHPTGFPAFVLFGWLFTHVVAVGTVAFRTTLMCVVAMSGAAWIVFRIVADETGAPAIGLGSALAFAFTDIAWTRGTRTEVHAVAAFFVLLTLLLALRWTRVPRRALLLATAASWGVALSTHALAALMLPGLVVLLAARAGHVRVRGVLSAAAVVLATMAMFYAYLPIRSAIVYREHRDPTLALGIPAGRPFWDYDHPSEWAGFVKLVGGTEFSVDRGLNAAYEIQTYTVKLPGYIAVLLRNFRLIGVAGILAGLVVMGRETPLRAAGFAIAGFAAVPFALGFSSEADPGRYFLGSLGVCASFIGVAAAALARRLTGVVRWVPALLVAVLAIVEFRAQSGLFAQRNDPGATAFLQNVRVHTPPHAILIAPWLYATPLAYAAYVDRSLGDRIVETAWLSDDADRVPTWLRTRPVVVVDVPWGEVPGYRTVRIFAGDPPLYAVVKR